MNIYTSYIFIVSSSEPDNNKDESGVKSSVLIGQPVCPYKKKKGIKNCE